MNKRKKIGSASEAKDLAARLRPIVALETLFREHASPVRMLEAARAAASALSSETTAALQSAIDDLEADVVHRLSEFEADLRELAQTNGWRLEGIWPTFQVERGIEIRVEASKRVVRVAGQALDPTDLDALADAIRRVVRDLVPRTFSSHDMLEQLRHAHSTLSPGGGQVPILALYGRFVMDSQSQRFWRDAHAKHFVGLSVDQFRARFSRMLNDGATVTRDGSELRLLPPLDPKDALFVYQPAEGRFGYVGRIEFVGGRS